MSSVFLFRNAPNRMGRKFVVVTKRINSYSDDLYDSSTTIRTMFSYYCSSSIISCLQSQNQQPLVENYITKRLIASCSIKRNIKWYTRVYRDCSTIIHGSRPLYQCTTQMNVSLLLQLRTFSSSSSSSSSNDENQQQQLQQNHTHISLMNDSNRSTTTTINHNDKHDTNPSKVYHSNNNNHNTIVSTDNNQSSDVVKPNAASSSLSSNTTTTITTTWIDIYIPKSYQPYAYLARLDKPIGVMLLFWPCTWSIGLALMSDHTSIMMEHIDVINTICIPYIQYCSLFMIGAITMRGAGCTMNDIWDVRYDQHVERTKHRPLVLQQVSIIQAIQFMIFQSMIGFGVLASIQPHMIPCIYWGSLSIPLIMIYPLMKRCFMYPQLVLGLAMNWGTILGWVAIHGHVNWSIVGPLYVSGICWTIIYDTIYAHQDKIDDQKLQLHSTALSFGTNDTYQRMILHSLAIISWSQWLYVGYTIFDPMIFLPYYTPGVTMAYSHLVWQIHTADFQNPMNLSHRFRSNNITGGIVATAIATAIAAQSLTT